MFRAVERLGLWVLLRLPPEVSHAIALRAFAVYRLRSPLIQSDLLRTKVLGISFPNPVGAAAGLDKNAEAVTGILAAGFGYCEVGTVTPLQQTGNSKPRVFRLRTEEAVLNRFGFNSDGAATVFSRLQTAGSCGVVGVNIGANNSSPDRIADYVQGVGAFAGVASYLTLNVSSPNTKGLRDLQTNGHLRELIRRAVERRDFLADQAGKRVPLLVKLAPDLLPDEMREVARTIVGSGVDGCIISNTTTSRPGLEDFTVAREAGGLSGKPLFEMSTIQLACFRKLVGPAFPLIGVGGVDSGETAWAKFAAGANLIQLYTGVIYRGPSLVREICDYLTDRLAAEGYSSISDIVGIDADAWAALPVPALTPRTAARS